MITVISDRIKRLFNLHGVDHGHARHSGNESVFFDVLVQPVSAASLVQELRSAADRSSDRPKRISSES
jgi:hypothetical protein